MGHVPDDLDFPMDVDFPGKTGADDEETIFFDDEPIESILYGEGPTGPSQASLYQPAGRLITEIIRAQREDRVADLFAAVNRLSRRDTFISSEMCRKVIAFLEPVFPLVPNAVVKHDVSILGPLFERIWALALERTDMVLLERAGTPLFRWYEHHGKYEEARRVLMRLVQLHCESGDRDDEAIMTNNLGFEYLLEKRWGEAAPLFEESARIFEEVGNTFQHANVRANYWTCRFALVDYGDIESTERELKEIANTLGGSGRWYERKPLVLLAGIEERRGNIKRAMEFVQRAIKSSIGSGTRYPEVDMEYLEALKKNVRARQVAGLDEEIRQITGEFVEVTSSRCHREGTHVHTHEGTDIGQIINREGQSVKAVWAEDWTEVSPGIETCGARHRPRRVRVYRRACPVRILLHSWYEYVSCDCWGHNSGWNEEYWVKFEA